MTYDPTRELVEIAHAVTMATAKDGYTAKDIAQAARGASHSHRLLPALQAEKERLRGQVKAAQMNRDIAEAQYAIASALNAGCQARVKELEEVIKDLRPHVRLYTPARKALRRAEQALRADEQKG